MLLLVAAMAMCTNAWVLPVPSTTVKSTPLPQGRTHSEHSTDSGVLLSSTSLAATPVQQTGNLHGQGSCFLPLQQLDQDFYAPRIVQVRDIQRGVLFVLFVFSFRNGAVLVLQPKPELDE